MTPPQNTFRFSLSHTLSSNLLFLSLSVYTKGNAKTKKGLISCISTKINTFLTISGRRISLRTQTSGR